MKKLLITSTLVGAAFLGSVVLATQAKADSSIYRLYNSNSGEHLYSTSAAEKENLVANGWTYEGIGWTAPASGTAVYRVFNPNAKNAGSHYYTANKPEAVNLVAKGWKWDNNAKAVFYSGGAVAVQVAYNASTGAHNYTTSASEQSNLLKSGWKFGATAFYGVSVGAPSQQVNLSGTYYGTNKDGSPAKLVLSGNSGTYFVKNDKTHKESQTTVKLSNSSINLGNGLVLNYGPDPAHFNGPGFYTQVQHIGNIAVASQVSLWKEGTSLGNSCKNIYQSF